MPEADAEGRELLEHALPSARRGEVVVAVLEAVASCGVRQDRNVLGLAVRVERTEGGVERLADAFAEPAHVADRQKAGRGVQLHAGEAAELDGVTHDVERAGDTADVESGCVPRSDGLAERLGSRRVVPEARPIPVVSGGSPRVGVRDVLVGQTAVDVEQGELRRLDLAIRTETDQWVDPHVCRIRDTTDDRELGDERVDGDLRLHRCRRFVARRVAEVDERGHEQPDLRVRRGETGGDAKAMLGDEPQRGDEAKDGDPQPRCAAKDVNWTQRAGIIMLVDPLGLPRGELLELLGRRLGDPLRDQVVDVGADRLEGRRIGRFGQWPELDQSGLDLCIGDQLLLRFGKFQGGSAFFTAIGCDRGSETGDDVTDLGRSRRSPRRQSIERHGDHAGQQRRHRREATDEAVDRQVLGVEDVAVAVDHGYRHRHDRPSDHRLDGHLGTAGDDSVDEGGRRERTQRGGAVEVGEMPVQLPPAVVANRFGVDAA